MAAPPPAQITVDDLTMAYGDFVIQRDPTFEIATGEIFSLMGGSGGEA
jgi:phospholipid/cholesterol/gamma-HCH transport system ATP-binding protein